MTQRRLNPRVNAIHKGLYGKPHPDYVPKEPAPVLDKLNDRLRQLADQFKEVGVSLDQLAKSFGEFSRVLRERHERDIMQRMLSSYIGVDYANMEAVVLHGTDPQIEFHGLRSGRYQAGQPNLVNRPRGESPADALAASRRFMALYGGGIGSRQALGRAVNEAIMPAIPTTDLVEFGDAVSARWAARLRLDPARRGAEYTERPIDITLEEPRNRDNPNDRQSAPTYRNPDANIRGFRRR